MTIGVVLATMVQWIWVFCSQRFTVKLADGSEIDIVGNVMDYEYDFKLNGEIIARVNKRLWAIRDIYAFEVMPEHDEQLMLAIVTVYVLFICITDLDPSCKTLTFG